ncbi:UvrD-helicase domain-containing protein [Clostridium sp. DJ247]|uniref:HelD family protein n=1 Tax=Clostridium sp. DJ247 TaxID=2726188 RepID=UPI001624965F|nr:UvrD-helicase domain-containing protein [Clostridium sp. DJ247]MBC2581790.1 AAA family ATPase [Clostridium sp. DJ247]
MKDFNENKQEEVNYLDKTLDFIKNELIKEENNLKDYIGDLIRSRKDMWEESVHFSEDFDRIPEMNHYLSEVNNRNENYIYTVKKINNYKRMLNSPYFGRFDFLEEGFRDVEKIYIGLHNLMDSEDYSIYVYDWRAPIASIFYRNELGRAAYNSPNGSINGNVFLKRQYKIKNSKLEFFFDSNIRINDDILQEVLSRNSSTKMKNIVETIQKEQDIIIRDTENELLIVQGVAGSGKTSIALHRIAFLLYEGLNSKLASNNVIIISPNDIFSKYISHVLPELGEENVEQVTFDGIVLKHFGKRFRAQTRHEQLETLINAGNIEGFNTRMSSIEFKGSLVFKHILDRLLQYCERSLIKFKDIYYDGKTVETKEQLKNSFLDNKIGMPIAKRLKRIESIILNKIHPLRKRRLEKIEKIVQKSDDHVFEIRSFSRLLSIKESKLFMDYIRSFTEVDFMHLYKTLFNKKGLLFKLSKGLELPYNIKEIILETAKQLEQGKVPYEDCAALIYLKLKLEGLEEYSNIKQVVVDEAQDYYPLQYEIFKLLFGGARYTVLGDFNQSLEKDCDKSIYDEIDEILNKRKSVKLFMRKSYRSSYEITVFAQKLLNNEQEIISFDRYGSEPLVIFKEKQSLIDKTIIKDIEHYESQGYGSIAVICKTQKEADEIQSRLRSLTHSKILNISEGNIEKGVIVVPAYLAKGLEFDVVLVYNASSENYKNEFDRKLLYVACTRALHQLVIYHTGEKSAFLA